MKNRPLSFASEIRSGSYYARSKRWRLAYSLFTRTDSRWHQTHRSWKAFRNTQYKEKGMF
jgi:hypothetical protein